VALRGSRVVQVVRALAGRVAPTSAGSSAGAARALTGALPGPPQGVVERRRELDTTIAADRALIDRIADLQAAHLHQLAALPTAARSAST